MNLPGVISEVARRWADPEHPVRAEAVSKTLATQALFTEEAVAFAINQQMSLLSEETLAGWQKKLNKVGDVRRIAVLNPGNIPMVGLQDVLAVTLAGHAYLGVLSSRSPFLLPAFAEEVRQHGAALSVQFYGLKEALDQAQALIASGSDDTMNEVESMADRAGIPEKHRWIRKSRFSVAVLDGKESEEERESLAEDVLLHEGLGCRNVALVFAPKECPPDPYLASFAAFRGTFPAPEATRARLRMQRAFLKAVDVPHAFAEDYQFLVSRGDAQVQAPCHLRWVDSVDPRHWIDASEKHIQGVFCPERLRRTFPEAELLGQAQRPGLDWKPDGVDHIDFLGGL